MPGNKLKYILLSLAVCVFLCGCSTTTEFYVYDEHGVEVKLARIRQEREGLAQYQNADKTLILKVDTRHKNWLERNVMPLLKYGADHFAW
jgi:uncharacterized protein YceK